MKSKLLMFVLVLTCIFSCCNVVYGLTPPPTFSGTIFLPKGAVAPAGGISVKVTAQSPKATYTKESIIKEGESSIGYVIPILTVSDEYKVRCELTKPVEGYDDICYYAQQNFFPLLPSITLSGSSHTGIDFNLVESKVVTGTVSLPDGLTAQRDSNITVHIIAQSNPPMIYDVDPVECGYFSKEVNTVIKKGENSASFSVDLPVCPYEYYFNYEINDYISGMRPNSHDLNVGCDLAKDTSISLKIKKGNIIKGKVSLPAGEIAGAGGFPVTVSALYFLHIGIAGPEGMKYYVDRKVIIPEGANSVDYEITVYPEYSEYYMLYNTENDKYFVRAFYSTKGMVATVDRDSSIDAGKNVNDINLTILPNQNLHGDINNDGVINAIDLAKLRSYLLGSITLDEQMLANSDLNLDGAVNSIDFAFLRNYILGFVKRLPVI